MTKLSDYVIRRVARGRARRFLLPGGGCMHLVDSLGREKRLRFVCNLHEQACAIAADAYSQYTDNLGVALVTTGPGGTNAITGVVASWLDSIPTLIVSGQVNGPTCRPAAACGRWVFRRSTSSISSGRSPSTRCSSTTPFDSIPFRQGAYLAKHGRPGPVWIDIPLDVQAAELDEATLPAFDPSELPDAGRTADFRPQAMRRFAC